MDPNERFSVKCTPINLMFLALPQNNWGKVLGECKLLPLSVLSVYLIMWIELDW